MNSKAINFIKDFSYILISNLISLIVSILVVLIIPKLVGVEEYGYWQLYLFYASYVGFMHFGWSDGIYLRYGGKKYSELDKMLFFSQFYMLVLSQIIIASIIALVAILFLTDQNRSFIMCMTSISLLILNIRQMLLLILQGTDRIKEYARATIIGRIVYFFTIIFFLIIGIREYQLMIVADLIGNIISLFFAMYYCKEIVFNRVTLFYFSFKEAINNISAGIKLTVANIASTLIIGVVRFGIERSWDVATFGRVSLTLSVSGLMILFINAIGIVIFPILRRTHSEKLPNIYVTIRDFLMVSLLGVMFLYFPLRIFLTEWLPKYSESLIYMELIFPMSVYEGKIVLLINTYLKTLRKEKLMLQINLIMLFISVVSTIVTTVILRNLN